MARLIAIALAVSFGSAIACQICLPFPKKSAADHLIEADAIVLARENPQKPFSLLAVEVIKGEVDDKAIDLFLDSQSRRTLAVYPGRKVVCIYRNEGPDAGWQRLGMTDEADVYEPAIRKVLKNATRWKEHPEERLEFFSQFLGHEDGQMRPTAHLERRGGSLLAPA